MEDPTVMTRQPAVPRQRPDQGRVRSAVRQWPQWVCYATACWSLLYGVLGSFWALGGAGFPFGGAHDDTVLATSRAATAGPVIAAVSLAGGALAFVMAQGRWRGPARRLDHTRERPALGRLGGGGRRGRPDLLRA